MSSFLPMHGACVIERSEVAYLDVVKLYKTESDPAYCTGDRHSTATLL